MLFPQNPLYKPLITHRPGTAIWLFQYNLGIKVYPTCIEFFEDPFLGGNIISRYPLAIDGPVSQWTAILNAPQSKVEISGFDVHKQFFRYILLCRDDGIEIIPKKGMSRQESFLCTYPQVYSVPLPCQRGERLDLGGYKQFVWEERFSKFTFSDPDSYRELLQLLYEYVPPRKPSVEITDSDTLLGMFIRSIESGEEWFSYFTAICECALDGVLVFQPEDRRYLGYSRPVFPSSISTYDVLSSISYAIRRSIISITGTIDKLEVELVPSIPRIYPAGRIWNMNFFDHSLCLEWRKKKIRRLMISTGGGEPDLMIHSKIPVIEFSLRETRLSSKKIQKALDKPLHLKAEMKYLCDNFFFASSQSEVIAEK